MSVNIGANDASNVVFKSQMTGVSQNLRSPQSVKETDKSRDTEQTREADPESTPDSQGVGSAAGTARPTPNKHSGQEFMLGRLGRGQVQWNEDAEYGQGWLPAILRPHSRTAGTSNEWNVPYWLLGNEDQHGSDSPMAAHRKLLNGLRSMVNVDIQQYIKSNDPPYAKKTLRDIYNVLNEDGSAGGGVPQGARQQAMTGDPGGLNATNWKRAMATFDLLENPQPELGEAFEMVA
jgi:hypothetical protein